MDNFEDDNNLIRFEVNDFSDSLENITSLFTINFLICTYILILSLAIAIHLLQNICLSGKMDFEVSHYINKILYKKMHQDFDTCISI